MCQVEKYTGHRECIPSDDGVRQFTYHFIGDPRYLPLLPTVFHPRVVEGSSTVRIGANSSANSAVPLILNQV